MPVGLCYLCFSHGYLPVLRPSFLQAPPYRLRGQQGRKVAPTQQGWRLTEYHQTGWETIENDRRRSVLQEDQLATVQPGAIKEAVKVHTENSTGCRQSGQLRRPRLCVKLIAATSPASESGQVARLREQGLLPQRHQLKHHTNHHKTSNNASTLDLAPPLAIPKSMGQYTSRPDRARLQRARAREQRERARHSTSTATAIASTATASATTPLSSSRPPATTQPSPQIASMQQNLRRRRSSTNTQSSQPPSRRRRIPLRFWSRGSNDEGLDSDDLTDSHLRGVTSDVSSTGSAENRFIEELDDIASHLSQTLQQLPSNPTHNSIHPTRSSASINSDLGTSGPISFLHQTEMLARLLEVAATSTVVTLMGSSLVNGRRFDNTSRSENDHSTDSTFQEFVTSLRNGLLTSELSRNYQDHNADNMTFFRAFRFDSDNISAGTPAPTTPTPTPAAATRTTSNTDTTDATTSPTDNNTPAIPVMIVGVRSVQQGPEAFENAMQDNADWFVRDSEHSRSQIRSSSNTTSASTSAPANTTPSPMGSTTATDRREDIQEPNPTQPIQRSWVIFVMGNSFAWNHPLLSAPSLMNENPTYEDLLNLQELIGQVKPQVTTQEELLKHDDQLFELDLSTEIFAPKSKYPVYSNGSLTMEERCQICLTEYENNDVVRKLTSCNHFYHQECIDTWLLNGKNNCPLCRSKGISSQDQAASTS